MKDKRNIINLITICFAIQGVLLSCKEDNIPDLDFRQEMRDFVTGISDYAKGQQAGFIIVPQNGIELIIQNGESFAPLDYLYLDAIDGNGQEDLFYGYEADDQSTPQDENDYLKAFLDRSKDEGNVILVTDYCSTNSKIDDSYEQNFSSGYISFAADHRELDNIPVYPTGLFHENDKQIEELTEVKNFLYLINTENFQSKDDFISAVTATNYDLLIMDLFFEDNQAFSEDEINLLRQKANGGKRIILCYMSIGEAENYRYYWQEGWKPGNPSWIDAENPDWEGNYKVRYWEPDWQHIIFGEEDSYLKKIMDAGYDGVYLDIIDAFEYFE